MTRGWAAVGLGAVTLVGAVVVISMSQIGCGGGSSTSSSNLPTPTPIPTRSVITVSVSPNPIIAEPSGDSEFPWAISFNVTVNETAGLACNINRVITRYRNKTTGTEFDGAVYNPDDFIEGTGSNFIGARSSKSFSLGTAYRLAFGGKEMTMTLAVEVIDANGNVVTASTEVEVVKRSVGGRL